MRSPELIARLDAVRSGTDRVDADVVVVVDGLEYRIEKVSVRMREPDKKKGQVGTYEVVLGVEKKA